MASFSVNVPNVAVLVCVCVLRLLWWPPSWPPSFSLPPSLLQGAFGCLRRLALLPHVGHPCSSLAAQCANGLCAWRVAALVAGVMPWSWRVVSWLDWRIRPRAWWAPPCFPSGLWLAARYFAWWRRCLISAFCVRRAQQTHSGAGTSGVLATSH